MKLITLFNLFSSNMKLTIIDFNSEKGKEVSIHQYLLLSKSKHVITGALFMLQLTLKHYLII